MSDMISRQGTLDAINNLAVFSASESDGVNAKAVSVIHKATQAIAAIPAAQPATVTVEEAARVLLDAFGEDKWGGWEFPMVGLNAAIDAHGLALTDISRLGFRCSPQTMLAKSFRAALRAIAGDRP